MDKHDSLTRPGNPIREKQGRKSAECPVRNRNEIREKSGLGKQQRSCLQPRNYRASPALCFFVLIRFRLNPSSNFPPQLSLFTPSSQTSLSSPPNVDTKPLSHSSHSRCRTPSLFPLFWVLAPFASPEITVMRSQTSSEVR